MKKTMKKVESDPSIVTPVPGPTDGMTEVDRQLFIAAYHAPCGSCNSGEGAIFHVPEKDLEILDVPPTKELGKK